jgi:hypothetical protein
MRATRRSERERGGALCPQLLVLVVEGVKADGKVDAAGREHVVHSEVNLRRKVKARQAAAAAQLDGTMVASGCPTRWMRRVYFFAAARAWSSLLAPAQGGVRRVTETKASQLAPVITILPDSKTSAVVLGSRRRMVTAEKRLGLYLPKRVMACESNGSL